MDPHLVRIPGLTPLTTRRLPGRDLQALCRQANGALDAQVLGFGALDQFLADFLERLHFARGEGDADLVDFLRHVRMIGESEELLDAGGEIGTYGAFAKVFLGLLVGHLDGSSR